MEPVIIDLEEMFPMLEHQRMRYVLHLCGLRDIPAQTRLIEYEGLEAVGRGLGTLYECRVGYDG